MASITCSTCQTEAAEGTQFCPGCGAALAGAPAGAPATSVPPTGTAPPPASSNPQIKFDAAQLAKNDWTVGIASLVLLISLFLPWFSASIGALGTYTGSGLNAHGYLYIVLILSIVIVAYFVIKALSLWAMPDSSPLAVNQILLVATAINVVLVVIAFIFKPNGAGIVNIGWSWGAFVGLIAAVVAVVPLAGPAIRARQSK